MDGTEKATGSDFVSNTNNFNNLKNKSMTPEDKKRISDLIEEHFDNFEPLVLTIDKDIDLPVEECINWSFLLIDLSTTKTGEIIDYIVRIQSGQYPIVFFKNIDCIRPRKDKADWEKLILYGLKSEDKTFVFNDTNAPCGLADYHLPFSKIWVLCTCSEYPEFLKLKEQSITRSNAGV